LIVLKTGFGFSSSGGGFSAGFMAARSARLINHLRGSVVPEKMLAQNVKRIDRRHSWLDDLSYRERII
jgi:hypothetical protein